MNLHCAIYNRLELQDFEYKHVAPASVRFSNKTIDQLLALRADTDMPSHHFHHPEVLDISRRAFDTEVRTPALTDDITRIGSSIRDQLEAAIEKLQLIADEFFSYEILEAELKLMIERPQNVYRLLQRGRRRRAQEHEALRTAQKVTSVLQVANH